MKKVLLFLALMAVITNAELLTFKDATVKVDGDFTKANDFNHSQPCGDYDGDGAQDVFMALIYTDNANTDTPSIIVHHFLIYSYKKKATLLQFDYAFINQSHTNPFSFIDLDNDGDNELIVNNYIFDYLSDGVVKK